MKFIELKIPGAWLIETEPTIDSRGSFSRLFCAKDFAKRGMCTTWSQNSESHNLTAGTLRGLHWQDAPHSEIKLIRCLSGSIFDVIVDLREKSRTYGQWTHVELSAERGNQIYIPAGCAHGFQTLVDNTRVNYSISEPYTPESSRGIKWDDPSLAISWPITNPILSHRDQNLENFNR